MPSTAFKNVNDKLAAVIVMEWGKKALFPMQALHNTDEGGVWLTKTCRQSPLSVARI